MRAFLCVLLGFLAFAASEERQRYDNYKVLEVTPKTKAHTDYLRQLQLNDDHIDFWDDIHRVGQGSIKLMVSPKKYSIISTKFAARDIPFTVVEENVQRNVDAEYERISQLKAFDINDFNTLEDIESQLNTWNSACPVSFCGMSDIGKTHEGRTIWAMRLSTGAGRPGIYLDATIHAREWLATATILKIMNNFYTNYGSDSTVTSLLDSYDWYFVPVANPDGYAYTRTSRYWRKNRAPNAGSSCLGTDLNRNFNFRWGMEGVSTSPCSDLFCGSSGNSELETRAVANELLRLVNGGRDIQALVTFHSYGNMWMHPWGNTEDHIGFTCDRAPDHADMFAVAAATANAVENTYNTRWARGTSCEVIYETTGATDDWAKGVAQIKFPFNPELRGNDFVVNRNQIDPSFREVWNGLVAMTNAMKAYYAKA